MRESIPNSPKGREYILNFYLMALFLVSMAQLGINWRPPPSVHGNRLEKLHREVTGTEINNGCSPCTCSSWRKHKSWPPFWETGQVTNPSLRQTIHPGFWEQGKAPAVEK